MKTILTVVLTLAVIILGADSRAGSLKLNTAKIESLTKLKGKYNDEEGVFKVTSPRNDVEIYVDQWKMPPFMGLTSWASFVSGKKTEAMVMGDLVLFEDEVNTVMSAALNSGIRVTALHNHFFFSEPAIYYMHIDGEGSIAELATGIRACFEAVQSVRAKQPKPAKTFGLAMPSTNSITPKMIEENLQKGEIKDGMYKVVVGRKVAMKCGCEIGKEMGVNTWAAFAGTDDNAVVDGDFAVLESELQPVLKSLRASGVNIVAIHHHMVSETPRTLFLHYWGRGQAKQLAQAVKKALHEQLNGA